VRTLAIDIGGTKVSLAIVDFTADVPEFVAGQTVLTSELSLPSALPKAQDLIRWINTESMSLVRDNGSVDSIGVGFGGQFDSGAQRALTSLHVTGWDGYDIAELFSTESMLRKIPIVGVNDAKAAALAEASTYASSLVPESKQEVFLYMTLSTGIGGAIALLQPMTGRVEIVNGAQSLAGELGHLQVPEPRQLVPDQICACGGTHCLERVCSGFWIQRRTGNSASDHLADESNFSDWIADLTSGLWSAITLLDPTVICIGGGMSAIGKRLEQALKESIAQRCTVWGRKPPEVILAYWGSRSVLLGAALLAREVGNS